MKSRRGIEYDLLKALRRNSLTIEAGDDICAVAADELERLRAENYRLKARLLESDALLSGLLDNESLAEHARASVIEQLQDNRKALGDD